MQTKGLDPMAEIAAARARGFADAIEIGLHPADLPERELLFRDVDGIFFTSGLAPAEAAGNAWRRDLHQLRKQAAEGRLVGVGELGLDWHWNYGDKDTQIELMSAQTDIARSSRLPIVIHNRDADPEILAVLRDADLPAAGVMHCFSSDYTTAAACIDLGFMISFAGNVTYKNAKSIQDAAARIPLRSLLVETDAPYLSPQRVRGKPNTPRHIRYTYEFLAELRGEDVDRLVETVRENLQRVFALNRRG
jgi:TatD DNase family protein